MSINGRSFASGSSQQLECFDNATPMQIDGQEDIEMEDCKKTRERIVGSDGWLCSICKEPWETEGERQACCMPCGHLCCYSCVINRIRPYASSEKCRICNALYCKFEWTDVIKIITLPVVALDADLLKENELLADENAKLILEKPNLLASFFRDKSKLQEENRRLEEAILQRYGEVCLHS